MSLEISKRLSVSVILLIAETLFNLVFQKTLKLINSLSMEKIHTCPWLSTPSLVILQNLSIFIR
jgi:hypothetical protein